MASDSRPTDEPSSPNPSAYAKQAIGESIQNKGLKLHGVFERMASSCPTTSMIALVNASKELAATFPEDEKSDVPGPSELGRLMCVYRTFTEKLQYMDTLFASDTTTSPPSSPTSSSSSSSSSASTSSSTSSAETSASSSSTPSATVDAATAAEEKLKEPTPQLPQKKEPHKSEEPFEIPCRCKVYFKGAKYDETAYQQEKSKGTAPAGVVEHNEECLILAFKAFLYHGGKSWLLNNCQPTTDETALPKHRQEMRAWCLRMLWRCIDLWNARTLQRCLGSLTEKHITAKVENIEIVDKTAVYIISLEEQLSVKSGTRWYIKKRYSEICDFHDRLLQILSDNEHPLELKNMPKKTLSLHGTNDETVLKRKDLFDEFFKDLTGTEKYRQIVACPPALEWVEYFLGVPNKSHGGGFNRAMFNVCLRNVVAASLKSHIFPKVELEVLFEIMTGKIRNSDPALNAPLGDYPFVYSPKIIEPSMIPLIFGALLACNTELALLGLQHIARMIRVDTTKLSFHNDWIRWLLPLIGRGHPQSPNIAERDLFLECMNLLSFVYRESLLHNIVPPPHKSTMGMRKQLNQSMAEMFDDAVDFIGESASWNVVAHSLLRMVLDAFLSSLTSSATVTLIGNNASHPCWTNLLSVCYTMQCLAHYTPVAARQVGSEHNNTNDEDAKALEELAKSPDLSDTRAILAALHEGKYELHKSRFSVDHSDPTASAAPAKGSQVVYVVLTPHLSTRMIAWLTALQPASKLAALTDNDMDVGVKRKNLSAAVDALNWFTEINAAATAAGGNQADVEKVFRDYFSAHKPIRL